MQPQTLRPSCASVTLGAIAGAALRLAVQACRATQAGGGPAARPSMRDSGEVGEDSEDSARRYREPHARRRVGQARREEPMASANIGTIRAEG